MNYGDFIGVVTALLIVVFLGICVWAWSRSNKESFSHMAELPLNDQPDANESLAEPRAENHHE